MDGSTSSGVGIEPIGGREWLAMLTTLKTAFPDWTYNAADLPEEGDKVRVSVQISGTHNGELDLSNMGVPKVPASGTSVKLPREDITLTISDGEFISLKSPGTGAGGVSALLSQLGVKVRSPSSD